MATAIRFYATLREAAGTGRIEVDPGAGASAREVLTAAARAHPALEALLWDADGGLNEFVKVFVDGRELRYLQGLATPVPAGAVLDVFPPTAGG